MEDELNIPDSSIIMLVLESIKYIFSKNLEQKESKIQIEELGIHLGERVSNFLMSSGSVVPNTDEIIKFLSNRVWNFIFGKAANSKKHQKVNTYKLETDTIKMHSFLVKEKGNQSDEKLEGVLSFVCGIIKGVISTFNFHCSVTSNFDAPRENSSLNENSLFQYNFMITF